MSDPAQQSPSGQQQVQGSWQVSRDVVGHSPRVGAGGGRPIRVLLADDQPLVLAGLRLILCPEEGFDVVGACRDGAEVLTAYEALDVDVIVMDVRMPRLDGVEATRQLCAAEDSPPVLVLTTFGDDEVLSAALRAGAVGFLLKDAPGEEIVRAVRICGSGGCYLDAGVTGRVLAAYRNALPHAQAGALPGLTPRELDVLRLLARGYTNDEIGQALFISKTTVKTHLAHVFGKIGARDRARAIVYAFDQGLVRPGLE